MSYLEIKKVNGTEYASFVKKFSLMGKNFRINEHIGKNISTLDKKEYMRNNLDALSEKEFEMRKPLLENLDMAHNKILLFDVELMSIRVNNLMEIKENKETVLIEFAKEFIFNSNNIEGSKIPAQEVKKIIETGSSKHNIANEVREVYNSIDAMDYIQKGFKFNIASIKRLYYVLTKDLVMQNGEPYPRGFKKESNVVNNMETVPPEMVESRLTELLDHYKKNRSNSHPLELAFDFHLHYEEIHPFLDGNGRTGRLVMNRILMDHGYFPVTIYSDNSRAYFNAISKGRDNKRSYYQFMMEQTRKTYREFSSVIERL
ncbi:MAG: Fic family protein [Thermoplasmata archaeon]|nr:Fic family protein [Thermoplasmata archaeon]